MHTGRTIEELIELVQHIHTHNAVRPRPSHDLAAPDRNDRHHNDRQRYDQQRYDQHNPERVSPRRAPQSSPTTQPAWLAVFL